MSSVFTYHLIKLVHILSIILAAGGSFALAILGSGLYQPQSSWMNGYKKLSRFSFIGLITAIISGLALVFTFSQISHPIFDLKMTVLVIALGLGGYINHGVFPRVSGNEMPSKELVDKYLRLQRSLAALVLIIVILGVFI